MLSVGLEPTVLKFLITKQVLSPLSQESIETKKCSLTYQGASNDKSYKAIKSRILQAAIRLFMSIEIGAANGIRTHDYFVHSEGT